MKHYKTYILIPFLFLFIFSPYPLSAQEDESQSEPKSLLLQATCSENCGYSISSSSENKMFKVSIESDSDICNNIEQEGLLEESETFIHDKCMALCGYPESPIQFTAPNFMNCVSCVPVLKVCRPFNDGVTRCWDKPGAKIERQSYCLEKSRECFENCEKKSKVGAGVIQ